jgi:hypothetical protein
MTLSQIAADPRAVAGEEFAKCEMESFRFNHGRLLGQSDAFPHWRIAVVTIDSLTRTNWYFVKDGPGEGEA